jgi:hypothetical protein
MTTKTCVHDRAAKTVIPEPTYGLGGHFMLFCGISATPKTVKFRCKLCGRVFEETSDPEVCKKHMEE